MAEKKATTTMSPESAASTKPTPVSPTPVKPTTVDVSPTPANGRGFFSFHKTPPNELYRKLLPAILFIMTFVTVMTMLLIYMDTVALGAQQFRLNMSRDYELSKIKQDEPSLVSYVRQLQLSPKVYSTVQGDRTTDRINVIDDVFGDQYVGTFLESLPSGPQSAESVSLVSRGWRGCVLRASPPDYLSLRAPRTLHACLSVSPHPREVTYRSDTDTWSANAGFSSRVLCLPLYTILLATSPLELSSFPLEVTTNPLDLTTNPPEADVVTTDYVLLGGAHVLAALKTLPFSKTRIPLLEVRATNETMQNQTTAYLRTHNYTVKAQYPNGVIYILNGYKKTTQ